MLAFSSAPPSCVTPALGLREQAVSSLNSTNFLRIPKILRALPMRDVIRDVSHLGLLWHLWVTRLLRAWTPVLMFHLTHVLSQKVLSLTKPKGINRNPSAIILHFYSFVWMSKIRDYYGESKVLQYFSYMRHYLITLLLSGWQTTVDCEMLSSSDNLQVLLAR